LPELIDIICPALIHSDGLNTSPSTAGETGASCKDIENRYINFNGFNINETVIESLNEVCLVMELL